MPTNDVTIYHPGSAGLFRRSIRRSGGAERQMTLLARELARQGHRVALIVHPVPDPIPDIEPGLTLVERGPHSGTSGVVSLVLESARVLRSLWAADGRVVVVRGGTPVLGVVAFYCLVRRRRLIFSSANNFDFLPRDDTSKAQARLYRFGALRADAVVVQSSDQVELARKAFPEIRKLLRIASFADVPRDNGGTRGPTALLWAGRMVDYKRPDLFIDLAAAVPEAQFNLITHLYRVKPTERQKVLIAELKARAESTANLELESSLPHAELIEKLASAVAIVNTSDFEGMPNTFLEAWVLGVPVLTLSFDPDGVVEREGLGVAAGGSWERFVAGARELWEGRGNREALSQRTKAYVGAVHSVRAVGSQWEDLLRSLGAFESK